MRTVGGLRLDCHTFFRGCRSARFHSSEYRRQSGREAVDGRSAAVTALWAVRLVNAAHVVTSGRRCVAPGWSFAPPALCGGRY